ncbi:MAG: histidine kinase [Candidatus Competibacteraceae bacterium]|nr:histidine kinase [Candidatus Competibacteraceae bacterium]
MSPSSAPSSKQTVTAGFLPDFCTNQVTFVMVLLAELFALVLALRDIDRSSEFWTQLAIISLFVQWVVLAVAAVLCLCKHRLNRLSSFAATVAVLGLTLLITFLFSIAGWWFLEPYPDLTANATSLLRLLVRNLAISSIVTLIALRYFYVQHLWKRNVEAEARARLQALQARIHPHFLFNALNTIASLIHSRPDRAEEAVLDLADTLRSALAHQARITLEAELELTRRYLAIESLRLGERLRVDWQLDEDLPYELPTPALLLQPLVENAIHHGIQRLPEGGILSIRIERQPRRLRITVANPRPADNATARPGQGIAQHNIRQRLQLAYSTANPLEIIETPERYQITFAIPLEERNPALFS